MSNLAEVIEWKWGAVAACDLDAGTIIAWDAVKAGRAQPTEQEIADAVIEFDALASHPNLTPTQFHTMLNLGGYRDDIETYLNGLDQVTEAVFIASARAKLDYSTFFVRDDPMIAAFMAVLTIDGPTMDAMWDTAGGF